MAVRKPYAPKPVVPRINGSLSPVEIQSVICEKCRVKSIGFKENQKNYAFFTPHAWESLAATTHYGKWVPENLLESHYLLEGYFFIDNQGISSTVVTNVITPTSAAQGTASAQLYSKENNAYAEIKAKENLLCKNSSRGKYNKTGGEINPFFGEFGPPCRVGFGHTHPNIGCFFSSVDKTSVFAVPGEPWITMVVDPRREEILVAVGADLKTATVVTFKPKMSVSCNIPECEPKKADNCTTEDLTKFVNLINSQLESGCSAKIKISGKLPGSLSFRGKINIPKRRKKSRLFSGQAE